MPNKHCIFGSCLSDSRRQPNIRFVRFVKPLRNPERAARWVHLCGRSDFGVEDITQNTHICEKHFAPDVILNAKENPDLEPYPASASKISRPRKPRTHQDAYEEEDAESENDADDTDIFDITANLSSLCIKPFHPKEKVQTVAIPVPFGVAITVDQISIDIAKCKF
jgi:hypothetical protein